MEVKDCIFGYRVELGAFTFVIEEEPEDIARVLGLDVTKNDDEEYFIEDILSVNYIFSDKQLQRYGVIWLDALIAEQLVNGNRTALEIMDAKEAELANEPTDEEKEEYYAYAELERMWHEMGELIETITK